jgi:hypothetical protein
VREEAMMLDAAMKALSEIVGKEEKMVEIDSEGLKLKEVTVCCGVFRRKK